MPLSSSLLSCYGNKIDDLFVDKAFQRQGLGRKLLLWGINHIKQQGYNEIILHVAKWNQNAIKLYLETGFTLSWQWEKYIFKGIV